MIKRLKINVFRSIANLDISLDPVTVLVGRSGTGKSNVVQALRFLRNLTLDFGGAIAQEGGWERILPMGKKGAKPGVEIEFFIPGEERPYRYGLAFGSPSQSPPAVRLQSESLYLDNQPLFSRHLMAAGWNWTARPAMASPPQQMDGLMVGSFPSLQNVAIAYAALSSGIGFYHFPSSVLVNVTPDPIGSKVPGLWDNANNFKQIMRSIVQDFQRPTTRQGLLASLKKVNSSISSIDIDSLVNPQKAIVGHDIQGQIVSLSLDQESDGLRRFYAQLLALYQTPSKLTVIIEEPENGVFPGALALLADEFKAAPREDRGQVILTTHSPQLLDEFDVDTIRVVDMQDGKTIVGPVAREQRDAVLDHLMTTGELLTVDRPRIKAPEAAPVAAAGPAA